MKSNLDGEFVKMEKRAGIFISKTVHIKVLEHVFSKAKRLHGEVKRFTEQALQEKMERERAELEKEPIIEVQV